MQVYLPAKRPPGSPRRLSQPRHVMVAGAMNMRVSLRSQDPPGEIDDTDPSKRHPRPTLPAQQRPQGLGARRHTHGGPTRDHLPQHRTCTMRDREREKGRGCRSRDPDLRYTRHSCPSRHKLMAQQLHDGRRCSPAPAPPRPPPSPPRPSQPRRRCARIAPAVALPWHTTSTRTCPASSSQSMALRCGSVAVGGRSWFQ